MRLPEPFELPPVYKDGEQVGFKLPSREDQIRAFNDLVDWLRRQEQASPAPARPAAPREETDEMAPVDGWPAGTGHQISNQGEWGYRVVIMDERFRTRKEARDFAELMRSLLSEPRAEQPNENE